METEYLLLADDLGDRSTKGERRSHLLRQNAMELAKKLSLGIELLYVSELESYFHFPPKTTGKFKDHKNVGTQWRNELGAAKVFGEIKIQPGIPELVILKELERSKNCKFLVIGTQGRHGLAKLLLGSVAEEVLRNISTPALVLGPKAQEANAVLKIDENLTILLMTDLTPASGPAENMALDFCKRFSCELVLFHSVGDRIQKIRRALRESIQNPEIFDKELREMNEECQRNLVGKTEQYKKMGVRVSSLLFSDEESLGESFKKLDNFGLVIMGTHSRVKTAKSFIGSSAREILMESVVPVIVVDLNKSFEVLN